MKKGALVILVVLLSCLCRPTWSSSGAEPQDYFTIGALFPMTGPQAYYGRIMSRGALLAVDHINAAGGVDGYKFKLEVIDYQNLNVDLAINGLTKLIANKKVPFLLTSFSGISLAVQPICASKHIVMINGGAYSPSLIGKPYLYSNKILQTQTIPPMLDMLWSMNIRKIGLIHFDSPGGKGPADLIEVQWTKMGGEIVAREVHRPGLTNYTTYLTNIKAGRPEAIYAVSTGQDQAFIIKNARELGLEMPIIVSDWSADYHDIAGKAGHDVFLVAEDMNPDNPSAQMLKFKKEFETKWQEDPDHFAANYYEAVYYILPELVKRALNVNLDPFNGEVLEKVIWTNPSFTGLYTDKLVFNKDGTCQKPMAIMKIVDGRKTLVKRVTEK